MPELPAGTVTFLFTDIEGSTRLLHELGDAYADALAEHRRVLRDAFARHGGVEVDTQGDAFFVAFARASDAPAAAREAQAALDGPIRVRMGVHTGEPLLTDEGYVGIDVHRAARIAAIGHGGQVLVSQSTRDLGGADSLRDLGEHRLKDLTAPERIYQLGDGDFPPLKTLHQTNLPVQQTALIGRDRELSEVVELVRSHRLVTLTGAGGSGKTRLALQAAAELIDEFADGAWFVSLAALTDATLVEPTIASVVGAKTELSEFLRDKRLLLVLDNLEQLLPDVASVVARLDTEVLATSRERLNVYGEQEYPVPTLPVDEGVALFTERARLLIPGFEPDAHARAIVQRLDGLPLALELAAARVKVLTTRQIGERLGRSLDVLTTGSRDVSERQRTLRGAIEWSYRLLDDDEKAAFAKLGVFAGSFALDAAEAVCEVDVDALQSLVDKSLLRRTAEGRFFFLETIREYARELLPMLDENVQRRHVAYVADFVRRRARAVAHADRAAAAEVTAFDGDIRSALEFALARAGGSTAVAIVDGMWRFWIERGLNSEAYEWIRRIEALRTSLAPDDDLRFIDAAGEVARFAGDSERAIAWKTEEAELRAKRGEKPELAALFADLAHIFVEQKEFDRAEGLAHQAVSIREELGEAGGIAHAQVALANALLDPRRGG